MDPVTFFNACLYVFCALLRVWSVAKVMKLANFRLVEAFGLG
jgi:hypothetical protein